jgi:hypothetical protein
MATYGIYISNSTTAPDHGDEGDDYIHFICDSLNIKFLNNNEVIHEAGLTHIPIKISKLIQKVDLQNVIADHVTTGDYDFNDLNQFLTNSAQSGGDDLYLWIYGPNLGGNYVQFLDGSGSWQNYMEVRDAGHNFKLNPAGIFIGTIRLEQAG